MQPDATMSAKEHGPSCGIMRIHWFVVLLSMIAIAVFASFRIGATGLWLDEVYSVVTALDWQRMWDRLLHDEANMWLYYLLLHFWLRLGDSEFVIRGMSVLAGVVTLPVVYGLGRRLAGSTVGAIAALLLAVNVFFIRYTQEARAYSLVVLTATMSTYFFMRGIEEKAARQWVGFTLSAAGAVYAHFFGGFVLLAQLLSIGFLPRRRIPWWHLAVSGFCLAFLLLPIVLFQPVDSGQVDWLSKPALSEFVVLSMRLAGSRPLVAFYAGLLIMALLPVIRRADRDTEAVLTAWRTWLILLWLVVPPVTTYLVSILVKPLWVNRYLILCVPPLVLLGACGLSRLRRPRLRMFLVAVMLLLSARCLHWLYRESPQEDWRSLVRFVLTNASEGEPVLFYAYHIRQSFEYYYDRLEADPDRLRLYELSPEPYRPGGGVRLADPNLVLLREIAQQHDRTWLVLGYCWNETLGRTSQRKMVEGVLRENQTAVIERRFGYVTVRCYERTPQSPVIASSSEDEAFLISPRSFEGARSIW